VDQNTALWHLYCRHRADLFAYALALTRNREQSEDALHSAFAATAETRSAIRNHRAYLFRSVRNECFRIRREENQHAALASPDTAFLLPSPSLEPSDAPHTQSGALLIALNALSEDRREVVMLRFYSRLRFREIARVMEQPLPTVASHYRRALKQLAQLLEASDHDD
jgi:RNA polymerase sigma-70 factor (ECF subfamily)